MNSLREQDITFVKENLPFFERGNLKLGQEGMITLFGIYSWITGQTHKPTGCGRCVTSARKAVYAAFQKQQK